LGIVWLADEAIPTENANLFDYRIFGIVPLAFVRTNVFPEFRQFKVSAVSSTMPAISCPTVFHIFFFLSSFTTIFHPLTLLSYDIHLALSFFVFFFVFSKQYISQYSFDQSSKIYRATSPLLSFNMSLMQIRQS